MGTAPALPTGQRIGWTTHAATSLGAHGMNTLKAIARARKTLNAATRYADEADTPKAKARAERKARAAFRTMREAERLASWDDALDA